jgi:uncharacterized membrane protein YbaN (DUF454 family)
MKAGRVLFVVAGTVSLGMGVIGIIVPGLPTTPFLLLSAWLYLHGSKKMYNALLGHKHLGRYIENYREVNGMTLTMKLSSISLMWFMIFISCKYFIGDEVAVIIVLLLGGVGTVVMGLVIPTVKK